MKLWIVQQFEGTSPDLTEGTIWRDVVPTWDEPAPAEVSEAWDGKARAWRTEEPGEAFAVAVLRNYAHRLNSVSYRVLPYDGGATFHVGINVDAQAHAEKEESAHA